MILIKRCFFFFTPIDFCDLSSSLDIVTSRASSLSFDYVVTPNIDHLMRISSDQAMRSIYADALLSLCDSRVLRAIMSLKRYPVPDVVAGSDLTKALFELGVFADSSLTIIGCSVSTIDLLKAKYKIKKINHYNPPMGFINSEAEINKCRIFIKNNPAPYVLFAVGSPQQELLASFVKQSGGCVGVGLCIGASINFLVGLEKRAPVMLSKIGFEWLYRLCQDPKRLWRRYFSNFAVFGLALRGKRFSGNVVSRQLDLDGG